MSSASDLNVHNPCKYMILLLESHVLVIQIVISTCIKLVSPYFALPVQHERDGD